MKLFKKDAKGKIVESSMKEFERHAKPKQRPVFTVSAAAKGRSAMMDALARLYEAPPAKTH